MDVAGLSDERDARSVATYVSAGARDRRGRHPHALRPASGHIRQAGGADRAMLATDTADQRQADYFLRLFMQNRRLLEQRIDGYHKAIAVAEARGDSESASVFRRSARAEEQERNTLDALIENLQRRFPADDTPVLRGRFMAR
jgi:hypothetical protein